MWIYIVLIRAKDNLYRRSVDVFFLYYEEKDVIACMLYLRAAVFNASKIRNTILHKFENRRRNWIQSVFLNLTISTECTVDFFEATN
jgi:hypothetical protein